MSPADDPSSASPSEDSPGANAELAPDSAPIASVDPCVDPPGDPPLDPPLIVPGKAIAAAGELSGGGADRRTKKFRLILDQGHGPKPAEAFLVFFDGEFHAFLNACRHVGVLLDWAPNEFFDATDELLLCRTHGALYEPATGLCVGGPCIGKSLVRIPIEVSSKVKVRLPKG